MKSINNNTMKLLGIMILEMALTFILSYFFTGYCVDEDTLIIWAASFGLALGITLIIY